MPHNHYKTEAGIIFKWLTYTGEPDTEYNLQTQDCCFFLLPPPKQNKQTKKSSG